MRVGRAGCAYTWNRGNTYKDIESGCLSKNFLCSQAKQQLLQSSFLSLLGTPMIKGKPESSSIFERDIKLLCSNILAGLILAFVLLLTFFHEGGRYLPSTITSLHLQPSSGCNLVLGKSLTWGKGFNFIESQCFASRTDCIKYVSVCKVLRTEPGTKQMPNKY